MMKHSLSDGILKIYDIFNTLCKDANATIENKTNHEFLLRRENYNLNTVADHAGLYYLARKNNLLTNNTLTGDPWPFWAIGAELIATDIGFTSRTEYQNWADRNPALWENHEGYFMFTSAKAFGLPAKSKITLQNITDHYYILHENILSKELMIDQAVHIRKYLTHHRKIRHGDEHN